MTLPRPISFRPLVVVGALLALLMDGATVSGSKNALSRFIDRRMRKKSYTPLVFFTLPPGIIPECDAMEEVVRDVERELDVRVERLDILRQPEAEAVLGLVTKKQKPPFLYHRESRQTIHIPSSSAGPESSSSSSAKKGEDMPVQISRDKVRAWAKGRLVDSPIVGQPAGATKVKTPVVVAQDDESINQEDLIDEMTLTPLQLKGKRAIRERTEEQAKARMEQMQQGEEQ